MRKRKPRIYDDEIYTDFGEQASPLELQIGYALMPLVDEQKDSPLLNEIRYLRNEIDAEYGLPLPLVRIRDNLCLEPCEYRILLHGTDVGGFNDLRLGHVLCLDTGSVTGELSGEKSKEPAFGMDGILVTEDMADEAKRLGYAVVDPSRIIKVHLSEIIKKNITKFLNQCMVNTLINKVRDTNPDVIDDVFFMHHYSTADFKTILNWLLEECVSIRDMNSILEALADNYDYKMKPVEFLDKVRDKIAWQFVSKLADKDKVIHVIRVSKSLSEALSERIYNPQSKTELPYYAFEPAEIKVFETEISEKAHRMTDKGYEPVFLIVSGLRTALSNTVRTRLGNWTFISDRELLSVNKDYSVAVEEELEVDEIKVNESCPVCD